MNPNRMMAAMAAAVLVSAAVATVAFEPAQAAPSMPAVEQRSLTTLPTPAPTPSPVQMDASPAPAEVQLGTPPVTAENFVTPPLPGPKGRAPATGVGSGLTAQSFSLARSGDIKVTLVTVQLSDKSATDTAAISLSAANAAIVTASNYWKTMSNNRLSLSVGATRTGVKSAALSTQSYSQIMDTVSRELGWVTNPYTALVVFIPTPLLSSNAYGAGWSAPSGVSGRVLMPLPGNLTNSVLSHEFGHVFGLMHSDSLECTDGASDVATNSDGTFADSNCSIREYGNTGDLMGVSQISQPTISSSLWQYGGFGRGDEILDAGKVTDSRSFTLTAWAGTAANRAVKFTDPISGEVYYLELRLPIGYDAATAVGGNRGVNIVQNGGLTAASSIILMPSTKPYAGYYSQNSAWQAGQTFTTHAGTRVSIDWISNTAAGVTIESTAAVASRAMAPVAVANTSLGNATSGVICGLRNGGCYQDYQGGAIIWSPTTGAQPSTGAIRSRWGALNFVDGPMGYPTSDLNCGLPGGGCYQDYQGGAIIWSPATGAHPSTGPTRTAWAKTGFLDGVLAYPTSDLICGQPGGGCYQTYQGGTIAWSPTTGAHPLSGSVGTTWTNNGALTGTLAYPTSDVNCGQPGGGCYQDFQGGAIIWSPATGAQPSVKGPIRDFWAKTGFLTGPFGYPTTPQTCNPAGDLCSQQFTGGRITWTPTLGAYRN